jgi:hypothetical protein
MRTNILPITEKPEAGNAARAILSLALSLVVAPAAAGSLQIVGYSGYLGEWELTATVTEDGSSTTRKEYSGPLSMKHVGLCTQDGPEEKSGEIHARMPAASSRMEATLWLDGVECGYQGVLSDFYSGIINCSGRETVPLKLWITESK